MKNTYLVCMLAFLGLGLADLFYLNSRILPALWTEEINEMPAPVAPPEIYSPIQHREAPAQERDTSFDVPKMGERITINAASHPAEERVVPKKTVMVENSDQPEINVDQIKRSSSSGSSVDSDQKETIIASSSNGPFFNSMDRSPVSPKTQPPRQPTSIKRIVVHFDNSSYELTSGEHHRLVSNLDGIMSAEKFRVIIDGHTDQRGAGVFDNELLSRKRADHVATILAKQGISWEDITARGFGASKPLDSADTPEAMAKNRRAEIKFIEVMP